MPNFYEVQPALRPLEVSGLTSSSGPRARIFQKVLKLSETTQNMAHH